MENELRDIKPLLEISDYSYALFLLLSFSLFTIVLTLLFFMGKRLWLTRKVNMRKVYFERLKSVNWEDTKHSAYEVTFLGRALATEPRIEEIYKQLLPLLEPYKYRKEVPPIDAQTINQYKLLVHVIDESI